MSKLIICRRGGLRAGLAVSTLAAVPSGLHAQAKLAPPNIIKAVTLVMSINPTLPPLQYVDDKGQLQGMRVELAQFRQPGRPAVRQALSRRLDLARLLRQLP